MEQCARKFLEFPRVGTDQSAEWHRGVQAGVQFTAQAQKAANFAVGTMIGDVSACEAEATAG